VLALNYTGMSVAYTIAGDAAGYVAEQGYGFLAATSALGYVIVAALYVFALRGVLPLEARPPESPLKASLFALRDPVFLGFAALAFVFPFSMGQVVTASPLFRRRPGAGRGIYRPGARRQQHYCRRACATHSGGHGAQGPFRFLPVAALLVGAGFVCYAAIPGVAVGYLVERSSSASQS